MATGGAWQSETFDDGLIRPAQAPVAMQQPVAEPPPPIYNPPAGSHRESAFFGRIMIILRIAQFLYSLIALAVMASNKAGRSYYSGDFTESNAYIAVVAMNTIVCFYALVQLVISVMNRSAVGSFAYFPTTTNAILSFVFDAILAFALMGVSAAAADFLAPDSGTGCVSYSIFCKKAAAAITMSFFSWEALAAAAALYPVRLLRLIKH